ncbi:amidophosphoribosyltransferase [Mycobacterium sp.]|uniref:amidophosphoribosyltransferase n=1 Tax=Mycobacterium sp. TaxID=1785 RepID=UPI002CEF8C1F|nr:amidophosphoribosyltransferase [Mycobacterium sp.]HME46546.1 amidophosphoribosyltransferase [Mycobacterium sp.]
MTDAAAEARRALRASAGGYLRNPVRAPGITCAVCATPVDGFAWCWRCRQDRRIPGLADLVVPLTYAIGGTQSATLLWHYKDDPVRKVREQHTLILNWLLYLAISLHERCVAAVVGSPVSLRMTIPSLSGRTGLHPFSALAQWMKAISGSIVLAPAPGAICDRIVSGDKFAVEPDAPLDGQHVLLLDDTWTTGSNAQSAALAVRRAGAAAVSVMVVGRWLSPNYGNTARFIKEYLHNDYDTGICPVTGGRCP